MGDLRLSQGGWMKKKKNSFQRTSPFSLFRSTHTTVKRIHTRMPFPCEELPRRGVKVVRGGGGTPFWDDARVTQQEVA